MEATLEYTEFMPTAKATKKHFANFHADLDKKANENLMVLVNSVLNVKRFELLKSVPGEMSNPLVGHRELSEEN